MSDKPRKGKRSKSVSDFVDYKGIVDAIKHDSIVYFLGAGVNLPATKTEWDARNPTRPPNGAELAGHMAKDFLGRVPALADKDLQHVATYYEISRASAGLYRCLHEVFDRNYPAGAVHNFLAELPSLLRTIRCPAEYPLIVTTNYDDILERALGDQPYEVYTYIEQGRDHGRFRSCKNGEVIRTPNKLTLGDLGLKEQFVIFKVHGTINRLAGSSYAVNDEYVITEDHYIDYLANAPIGEVVPMGLVTALTERSILYLGYALQDWHLRVLMRKLLQGQPLTTQRWSVQLDADEVYRLYSQRQQVTLIEEPLDDFISSLHKELMGEKAAQSGTSV